MQWTSQNIKTRSGTHTKKVKTPIGPWYLKLPAYHLPLLPSPHLNVVPDPRPVVWFCSKQSLRCLVIFVCLSLLACKVPLPLCVSLRRDLGATGPSGSVRGVTSHSSPCPTTGAAGWGWYLPGHCLTRPPVWTTIGRGKRRKTAAKTAKTAAETSGIEPLMSLPHLSHPWLA